MRRFGYILPIIYIFISCSTEKSELSIQAESYLQDYTEVYRDLYTIAAEAEWQSNTRIIEGDTINAARTIAAHEALAAFTGSEENIEQARKFLNRKEALRPIQVKQFETILYTAANNPATVRDVVEARIAAETAQVERLFGFDFKIDGKSVSPNNIDDLLIDSYDLDERLKVWNASKEVGIGLKKGLVNLVNLRNASVQALGYTNYFQYQVSDYGMETSEMLAILDNVISQLRPLYQELHTYIRYTLAGRYGVPVPILIPAHWLPNRWGQDWSALVEVGGFDLDSAIASKGPDWLLKQAEDFYVSLGFDELPASFWEKSSLYPLPADAEYKKNNHASAWHMDLESDVRSLMSVEANTRWYATTHHELGHIYYYMAYSNNDVPPLLRGGANRGFHEAIGSLLGNAALQKPFVETIGLLDEIGEVDQIQTLLKEALNDVIFIPFAAGVMTQYENELYSKPLDVDRYNERWWQLKAQYQGISPPSERGEQFCDAASNTHINDDAAQYYDYAISTILLYQLHGHIAEIILDEDPHATNYFGQKKVGKFLWRIMEVGRTEDWRELLSRYTGEDLSAEAMLTYYEPLMSWLTEQNEGRVHTLPSL